MKNPKFILTVILALIAALNGCSDRETYTENNFVGKWKSTRTTTPIYLYENGEWEIITDDGTVLQYGVWQYKNNKIMWSAKVDDRIGHDINEVLSVSPREFRLRERNSSTTIFNRLD